MNTSVNAKTEYARISNDRTIAYRSIGNGYPIILANRFRGNLDTWDPAFLYPSSVQAAKDSHDRIAARKSDKDVAMTEAQWNNLLTSRDYAEDTHGTYKKLQNSKVPVLGLLGENDISFAAEDWFAAKGKFPMVNMIYFAQTGHGPQHQFPELSAKYISEFIHH